MNAYKDIHLLCTDGTTEKLINIVNEPGFRTILSSDVDTFLAKLIEYESDAIILSPSMVNETTIAASLKACDSIAVIVTPDDLPNIPKFLEKGLTTFVPEDKLTETIPNFLNTILLNTKKSDVLMNTLNRLKNLAKNASDGIIIFDDHNLISLINKSAEKVLGISKTQATRKSIDDIFKTHPFAIDDHSEEAVSVENHTFETVNGEEIVMNSTYSLNYEEGKFAGSVLIFTKVSVSAMDRQKELKLLQYQQRYHSSQQNMAFKKQMLVMKDEMSNTIAGNFAVETYFKPLDILSGDLYGSINIKDGRYLFYVIDAMGKGLSASVTALQSSSFINHSLELSILKNDFDMDRTLSSFLYYIRDRLMEEEALCVAFALLDTTNETMTVSNYGMPPLYLVDDTGEIDVVRPNNLPIMRCIAQRNTDTYDLKNIDKFLMLSDGLTELVTTDNNLYMDHIKEDLKKSQTKKHFLSYINKSTNINQDDITFFFIKRMTFANPKPICFHMITDLDAIGTTSASICEQLEKDNIPTVDVGLIEYALSEIIMNAVEHGNLGLNSDQKQQLISSGEYDSFIAERTKPGADTREQKVKICYSYKEPTANNCGMLFISIQDEGMGFAPANLFKYHSFDGNLCHIDRQSYNGRGIFITDNLVDGLYYNEQGNCAYLLKLINS